MIKLKRAYDKQEKNEGKRYLIDHLWPRGVTKADLHVEVWFKNVSPSTALRKWFGHDPEKWNEFRRRYFRELEKTPEAWEPLLNAARQGTITLVFSARDIEHNNAVALKEFLEAKLGRKTARLRAA